MARTFRRLAIAGLAVHAVLVAFTALPVSADEGTRLRVMAANTSSGSFQSYPDPGPGTRIFQALDPDVVLIQEFNVNATSGGANDDDAVDRWVDSVFGTDYHWFREPGGDSIPNGVISRWPIVESGEWRDPEVSNRDFAFARIDVPGDVDLWVVSVHFLTRNQTVRDAEARALVDAIVAHPVPEEDYLVIGGDFNTDRRNEPALTTLGALVDTLGPFPHDGDDPPDGDTNARRRKPYDWVLADAELTAREIAVEIGDFSFPDGLVFDSRVFSDAELTSSFAPVLRNDSGAAQMQHMAVVRDFSIAGEEGPGPDFVIPIRTLDFGRADASAPPRIASSLGVEVRRPVAFTAIALAGSHPEEFALVSPDLGQGPVTLDADATLGIEWSPGGEPGARRVTLTLITAGEPGAVEIELEAEVRDPDAPAGEPLALGGFKLVQTGGGATITLPDGLELAPGGVLVVGRAASRAEFEGFWGQLPAGAVYVNGKDLAGEPGFPVINGGERYALLDPDGELVDPASGFVPAGATDRGRAYQRTSTAAETFTTRTDPRQEASPGRFEGTLAATGRPILSEISDAPGQGAFVFEFVEVVYDGESGP